MPGLSPPAETIMEQVRSCILRDAALQAALAAIDDAAVFADMTAAAAVAHGITITRDEIFALSAPDPIGLARWLPAAANAGEWPSTAWLPVSANAFVNPPVIAWAHFAGVRLTASFFEVPLREALSRPFNRAFPYRMTLDDFVGRAELHDALQPSGFIFHMSRCGSTLVSQMLAALSQNIVVSEAPPLDTIVQLAGPPTDQPSPDAIRALRAMVAALGRRRFADERHYVLKLDCWHTLALPLFRAAFPDVPWVFLYRDPVEVMVSQMRAPGAQVAHGALPPHIYGIAGGETMPREEYYARVLAKTCVAVLDRWRLGGGLAINYRELPGAVWTRILPHFGLPDSEGDRAEMRRASLQNAKAPYEAFVGDTAAKRREATASVRAAVDRHLADICARLEALSAG
jgi:hypothetical protein